MVVVGSVSNMFFLFCRTPHRKRIKTSATMPIESTQVLIFFGRAFVFSSFFVKVDLRLLGNIDNERPVKTRTE